MSGKREHKRRYNLRLEYISAFDEWLASEPKRVFFWKWHRCKKSRPVLNKKALKEGKQK